MQTFEVIDNTGVGASLALRDEAGRYHVARATENVPDIGTSLQGPFPTPGAGLVLGADSGSAYRLVFEQVNCDLKAALEWLYPRFRP